jgi:regulator of cell morphogenesis and NO signaling
MIIATQLPITPDTRIGDIVAARPALARLFEELRIDYCCGGKLTIAAASARRGLAVDTVVAMLGAATAVLEAGPVDVDAAGMSLTALADHIEHSHHAYLKTELPRLVEMAGRVAEKHGERDTRLGEIASIVRELAAEMFAHMEKEERILFPLARRIEAGERVDLAGPIAQLEAEHDSAGNLTERLRGLTDGFAPGPDACNTHRALLAGLAEFESDLHRHVHKENNILFPRALALGAAA